MALMVAFRDDRGDATAAGSTLCVCPSVLPVRRLLFAGGGVADDRSGLDPVFGSTGTGPGAIRLKLNELNCSPYPPRAA